MNLKECQKQLKTNIEQVNDVIFIKCYKNKIGQGFIKSDYEDIGINNLIKLWCEKNCNKAELK